MQLSPFASRRVRVSAVIESPVANLPSARGASFLHTWAELRSQVDQGLITREELEVRFDAEALAVLDEKIDTDLEYPLRAVDRGSRKPTPRRT